MANEFLIYYPFSETNLKFKMSLEVTDRLMKTEKELETFDGEHVYN